MVFYMTARDGALPRDGTLQEACDGILQEST
jgi:hypothetical protein